MKKILLLLPILGICLSLNAKIPLEEAIQRGIAKSLVIRNNQLETARLKLEKRQRELQKWFTLNLGGIYLFKSQQMEINLSEISIGSGMSITPEPIVVGAKHNYDLKLSLSQPLFTGNRLSGLAQLKGIELEMENQSTRILTIDISSGIKVSYFTYRMLTYQLQSMDAYLEILRLHRQRLSDYFGQELIKKSDLLETDIRMQEQLLIMEEIKMRMARERINFKSLCDTDVDDISVDYSEEIEVPPDIFSDFQSQNPTMLLLDAQIKHLGIQKKIARADTLPQVAGFAEIHYGRPGIDYFQNEWSLYFQGGISFDWLLFDWGRQGKTQKILDYAREKSKNKKEDYFREIKNQVDQLLESKGASEKKLAVIRNLIGISGEEARLKEEMFRQQQISNKDYLSSLAAREGYQSREKELQAQIEIIKVNINKLLGRLSGKSREVK